MTPQVSWQGFSSEYARMSLGGETIPESRDEWPAWVREMSSPFKVVISLAVLLLIRLRIDGGPQFDPDLLTFLRYGWSVFQGAPPNFFPLNPLVALVAQLASQFVGLDRAGALTADLLVLTALAGLAATDRRILERLWLVLAAMPLIAVAARTDTSQIAVLILALSSEALRSRGKKRLAAFVAGAAIASGWAGLAIAPCLVRRFHSRRMMILLVCGVAALVIGRFCGGLPEVDFEVWGAAYRAPGVFDIPVVARLFDNTPGWVRYLLPVLVVLVAVVVTLWRRGSQAIAPAKDSIAAVMTLSLVPSVPAAAGLAMLVLFWTPSCRRRFDNLIASAWLLIFALDCHHSYNELGALAESLKSGVEQTRLSSFWTPYLLFSLGMKTVIGSLSFFRPRVGSPAESAHRPRDISPRLAGLIVASITTGALFLSLKDLGSRDFPRTGLTESGRFTFDWDHSKQAIALWALTDSGVVVVRGRCASSGLASRRTIERDRNLKWTPLLLKGSCDGPVDVEIDFKRPGRVLEILISDENGERIPIWPLGGESGCDAAAARVLADEQDSIGVPGRLNGGSFDEVYNVEHGLARIDGDTSDHPEKAAHPYLFRLFILWSMKVLGVSPFAWRLPAAVFASLLPLGGFTLVSTLTRSRIAGVFSAAVIAADPLRQSVSQMTFAEPWISLCLLGALTGTAAFAFGGRTIEPFSWKGVALSLVAVALAGASKLSGFFIFCLIGPTVAIALTRNRWRTLRSFRGVLGATLVLLVCVVSFIGPYWVFFPSDVRKVGAVIKHQEHMIVMHESLAGHSAMEVRLASWLSGETLTQSFYLPVRPDWTEIQLVMMNPFAGVALLTACLLIFRCGTAQQRFAVFATVSYLMPWLLIGRPTYFYHFLPASTLAAVVVGVRWSNARWLERCCWGLFLAVSTALFLSFHPYATGTITEASGLDAWRLFATWNPSSVKGQYVIGRF